MVSDSFCLQKEVCIFVAFVHLRWRKGQKTLCFTGVLWAIFAYLAVVRSSVTRQYEVQEALVNYVESIISHPGVSGVRLRTPGETGMCRSQLRNPCPNFRSRRGKPGKRCKCAKLSFSFDSLLCDAHVLTGIN